jgi:hypothetical protein
VIDTNTATLPFYKPKSNTSLQPEIKPRIEATLRQLHEEMLADSSSDSDSERKSQKMKFKRLEPPSPASPHKFRRKIGIEKMALENHRKNETLNSKTDGSEKAIPKLEDKSEKGDFETIYFD